MSAYWRGLSKAQTRVLIFFVLSLGIVADIHAQTWSPTGSMNTSGAATPRLGCQTAAYSSLAEVAGAVASPAWTVLRSTTRRWARGRRRLP